MDSAVIDRLEKSFNALAHRGEELVDRFYALLFARNPQLRPLFPSALRDQKQKLLSSVILVMKNLRSPEMLRQPLIDMGRRHVAYGAQPEHYPVVRDTLVEVMASMAGPIWNDELTSDWKRALHFVSMVMLEGHQQAAGSACNAASNAGSAPAMAGA